MAYAGRVDFQTSLFADETPAPADLVARLEALRAGGALRDRGGNLYDTPVAAGLVRQDGRVFYPIRDGIPVLVSDAAFTVPALEA